MRARPAAPSDGVAWVTGASAGIGRAVAEELARRGWTVAISARRADALERMAAANAAFIAAPCDITDAAGVAAAVAAIEARGRPIALAVLNAGTYIPTEIRAFDLGDWRTQIEVNLNGTAACLAALLPRLLDRGAGQVCLVASVAGYRGLPRAGAYGATKAALINLAESLRLELAPRGICMSLVNPGFIRTPLTDRNDFPMPFLMEVEPAARRLVDGLESGRFETTFPRRFTWMLKLLRLLPYALYLPLAGRTVRR
jgi:NAD(P)-dependent dehydrogenase (short-subunit alcohol dehydrogenase family)